MENRVRFQTPRSWSKNSLAKVITAITKVRHWAMSRDEPSPRSHVQGWKWMHSRGNSVHSAFNDLLSSPLRLHELRSQQHYTLSLHCGYFFHDICWLFTRAFLTNLKRVHSSEKPFLPLLTAFLFTVESYTSSRVLRGRFS